MYPSFLDGFINMKIGLRVGAPYKRCKKIYYSDLLEKWITAFHVIKKAPSRGAFLVTELFEF